MIRASEVGMRLTPGPSSREAVFDGLVRVVGWGVRNVAWEKDRRR